jgi:signal transduction histidine kinase
MNEDIEKRFVQLSTLLETSRVVASSLDIAEVLDNILDQVQNLFDVERCAVVVLDRRADVFRIRASRRLSENYVTRLRIAPAEPNSTSMRALRNQTPIQISDTETDLSFAAFRERARAEGYRSVLAIPLLTYHASPAVLLLYKVEPYRYSYSELELASSFGHHVSVAMENAALFARTDERLQEQTRRLEAIVESLNDGLILESPAGKVLYCNQQALAWIHLSNREAQQRTSAELVSCLLATSKELPIDEPEIISALAGGGGRTFDLALSLENGRFRDLRIHLFEVTDAQGELLGRGQLWQDITHDKELDRMKSALISTVSHELRTPLAAIKGYVSTLLADDVAWGEQEQREFLQTISDETDRLAGLVKNLLDMSRIEAGTLQMHCQPYEIDELVAHAVQQIRPLIGSRLQIQMPAYLPAVWVDSSRIETVIRNLLENAAKYSPPETPIEMTIQAEDGYIVVQIRDYGPGVAPFLQEEIFDRFYRIDSRMTREVGGAGLGLAICKGFIEAHQGTIWVVDAHPGSAFSFSLPAYVKVKESETGKRL